MNDQPSTLQPYIFPITDQQVRTAVIDGDPWFVAKDVCEVLGISKYRDALGQLDADERVSMTVDTPGGQQMMIVVNEPGIFALTLISRSPKVKSFRRWVTHQVLPAIRRTGSYSTGPQFEIPQSFAEALELAARQARELETSRHTIRELEPAASAWNVLADATGDFSLRDAGHILNRDPAISTGQNRLMRSLRELGLVDRRGIPYARHSTHVVERPTSYEHPRTGEPKLSSQIRVTVLGLEYLHKRLGGAAPLDLGGDA